MAQLSDFASLLASERHIAVVCTSRADGSVQASIANAGVLDHPVGGGPIAALVVRGDALEGPPERDDIEIVGQAPQPHGSASFDLVLDEEHPENSVAVIRPKPSPAPPES